MVIRTQVISLILFLITTSINSFSQVSDSLFDLSCQNEDLIVLNEEMEVNITGRKTVLMIATVTNNLTIVIKTADGLSEFQPFKLPKKFDELYIYHAPTVRNIDWAYDNVEVLNFEANINSVNSIQIIKEISTKRVLDMEGFFGNINLFEYTIENLHIGDTLRLSYTYDIPFKDNWIRLLSNRIFFHGKYPKKSYSLSWCHNKDLEVDSLFVNHVIPEVSLEGNKFCYHWNLNNLPGCLDESGSRPYKTLPYFVFVPQSYDFEYTHFDSYVQEFIPPYFLESSKRQDELQIEYWDNVIGNKSKNNLHYQKVADRIIALTPDDTLGTARLRYFQQFMADSVVYDPALNYYNHNEDQIKQRAGVDLWGKTLKDNNIERIYGNIVPKLGVDLFTAYPVDIRVGEISPQYTPTVKDNDLLFGIALNDKTLGFVVPKSDKNNYYFEEVPFYYEEIPVLLLHYTDFPSMLEKRNFNREFRSYYTPASNWKDNYRKVQSKVNVDLNSNTLKFQTRVILSGQYSTLTRCVYFSNPIDSTINPQYHDPIWSIASNVEVKKVVTLHPQIYYPYKTTVNAEYTIKNLLNIDNNQITIKPGNWFKMIYAKDICYEARFLDYYPDFVGSDSYSYMLEFDKPVKLISNQDDIDFTNKYCHISFSIKQLGENRLLMTCNYSILSKIIDKESIVLVKEINDIISMIEQEEIVFELVK